MSTQPERSNNYYLLRLLLLMVFAFFIASIPHMNYPYPVHVDEWNQLAYSNAVIQEGTLDFAGPFHGYWDYGMSYKSFPGYYLLISAIQQISGVDFLHMPVYLPGIIFIITILAAYVVGRRKGFGWEAAFFCCLIPTTVGILGPGFMVPLAAGLLFIPLFLFLIDYQESKTSYILYLLFSGFLLLVHPPSALIMLIIVVPYVLVTMIKDLKRGALLLLVIFIPNILAIIFVFNDVIALSEQAFLQQFIPSYIEIPELIQIYGYIPLVCGLIGTIVLIVKNKMSNYGLVISLIALLVLLITFYQFHYGISLLYLRGLIYTLLIFSIVAGAGLASMRMIKIRDFAIGRYLYAGIIIVILIVAIPARLSIPYYKMMDEKDYQAFSWLKDSTTENNDMAVLDPWKATSFAVVTDKKVYTRIFPVEKPLDDMVYNFLDEGCRDTNFLEYNGITIVYNEDICENTELINVRKDVYLLSQGYSKYYTKLNYLKDPGMWEITTDRQPAYWNPWQDNIEANFLYPEPGANGGYSIGIEIVEGNPSVSDYDANWLQSVEVGDGQTYILGGWIKTDNIAGNRGVRIVANWMTSEYEWIGNSEIIQPITGTNDWQYYKGEITAPPDAENCVVSCQIINCTGKAWFDDMLFMEKPVNY